MRILWVKTELLHPIDKGGRIRSYQMLRALARDHHVVYLCLDDGGAAADARVRAREYCAELVTVPFRPAEKASAAFYLDLLGNLVSSLPYAVARYRSPALAAEVLRLAPRADLLVCDFLFPSQNVPEGLPVPKILFQHNVEAGIWQRHAALPQNALRRAYLREQWRRMRAFERAQCRRFDRVIAVSADDAELMRRDYGLRSVASVDTGVDLEYFTPPQAECPTSPQEQTGRAPEIVFVGSMDWMPNDEGIRWFAAQVFPRVRARVPQARLTIVGRRPSRGLRELAARTPGVEVTGTVADVRPYLARGAVSVVPLRVGGGTRLKIYEAMAMGIPVVSTTIGAEGLPLNAGEHLLIADTPEAQAEALVTLLEAPARAAELAARAREFVRARCSWDAVATQFIAACVQAPDAPELARAERIACGIGAT